MSRLWPVAALPAHIELSLVELEGSPETWLEAWSLLSPDEQAEADRFRHPASRAAFGRMRGALRARLGTVLGVDPRELRFARQAHGKPSLAMPAPHATWHFNVSHSGAWGALVLARDTELGIDIERVRPELDYADLAWRFFAPPEQAALFGLPEELRPAAFFACWTRKEAVLKAIGRGLSLPLDAFAVSVCPDEPARLLQATPEFGDVARWTLLGLPAPAGYAATLAWRRALA